MTTTPDPVLETREGAVATITLNAPDRLNALDLPMLESLIAAVERAKADPSVRVIALRGNGRGFCAGANLVPGDGGEVDDSTLYAVGRLVRSLLASGTPVVALVEGVVAGVGVSLALACDYVLCSQKASFMLAFSKIALMPDGGATSLVAANVGRARALRMALTAEKVDGATAGEWGLVSECVAAEAFSGRALALLTQLASWSPAATVATTAAINAATIDIEATLAREEQGQSQLLRADDFAEGVAAFAAKRPAVFATVRPEVFAPE